jgi:hypothetical protein
MPTSSETICAPIESDSPIPTTIRISCKPIKFRSGGDHMSCYAPSANGHKRLPRKLEDLKGQYEPECELLNQKGFSNLFRNIHVLRRVGGDAEQAISILESGRSNYARPSFGNRHKRYPQNDQHALHEQYSEQFEQLRRNGVENNPNQILNFLRRFHGDIEKVEAILNKRNRNQLAHFHQHRIESCHSVNRGRFGPSENVHRPIKCHALRPAHSFNNHGASASHKNVFANLPCESA